VIRFHLKRQISDWEFKEGRRLTIAELEKKSQVTRPTLSRILNQRGYNTTTDNIGKLCAFLNCRVGDLIEFVPDDEVGKNQG
jgi:putative transcriptional regulator